MGVPGGATRHVAAHAHLDDWTGTDVNVSQLERRLAELRAITCEDGVPQLRTSVMTHLAWVPEEWLGAAQQVMEGLAERHPSRVIILTPDPDAGDGLDAEVSETCFSVPGQERHVCAEVLRLRLRGRRAAAPASIVAPLVIPDLPVFLRWRGEPPFGAPEFEQLTRLADRLVVDSAEWHALPDAYRNLAATFARTAVSDIAWARTLAWRVALAELWPGIASVRELRVAGPLAEALLLCGWLRSRLARDVELVHDDADELELVAVDGDLVRVPRREGPTPADLLSDELDRFSRDPVYEAAAAADRTRGDRDA